ncbi:MAG: aspartyl-tRNA(Asn)/glutamyl-tRNA(Gln) amidotransferase subunit C [Candidatus Paceibacteria bacterium]|jgi:aspartyl-tRNA(Asn)/glutamyl-tRNA(Gln) amidotransferase subunit C
MTDSNEDLLRKTAALARLELSEAEMTKIAPEFRRILGAFEGLAKVDVEGVPPTLGATDLQDIKRPDEPRPAMDTDLLLNGSPDRQGEYFGVPKTIGGDE